MGAPTTMFIQLMIGLLGGAYLLYGLRQRSVVITVCGIGLSALPMFVSGMVVTLLVSAALLALPWFYRFD